MTGRSLGRLGAALGVVVLVLLGALLAVLPSAEQERAHSVFSTEPDGLRALYLTLEELGFPAQPWSDAPGRLDGPGTVLVLAGVPPAPPPLPPSLVDNEPSGASAPRRGRDLAHYRRFVEQGGTLLLCGTAEAELSFARDRLGFSELAGLSCEETESEPAAREEHVTLSGGECVALPGGSAGVIRGARDGEVLAHREDGEALGVQRTRGAGRIALLALPLEALENAALEERFEPALLLVRVLEALQPAPERVLFDEYALGGWRPAPVAELVFSPRLAWLSAHLLLLALVLCWRSAWSGPFPRDSEAWLAASPVTRARGFGSLLARAGRWELLARLLRDGVLQRLEARAGLRAPPGATSGLEARLAALAHGDERLRARLAELFLARAPRDHAELDALADGLRALERELAPATQPENRRRAPGARRLRTGS